MKLVGVLEVGAISIRGCAARMRAVLDVAGAVQGCVVPRSAGLRGWSDLFGAVQL